MSTQDNLDLVTALYSAFTGGDLAAILDALGEDVEWYHPPHSEIPWGGRRRGKQEVAQFFASLGTLLDVEQFDVKHMCAIDDRVIVLGHEQMRVKRTGFSFAVDWAHSFTLRAGKVVAYHEYTETAPMVEALRQN